MPLSDIAVLLSIGVSTPALAALLWRRGVRGHRLLTSLWVGFVGLVLVASMVAHCVDVLSRLAIGTGYGGEAFVYNFRVYSLMLLGAVLIAAGAALLRVAPGLSTGDASARKSALRTDLVVLAMVAPLIPIHAIFATALTVLAVVTLVVLLAVGPRGDRSSLEAREAEPQPARQPLGA